MKTSIALLATLLATTFAVQAQEAAPANRADVKAEAKAAVKSGKIVKGEGTTPGPAPKSTKTRAEVRKEAAAAEKAGLIVKGEGPGRAASGVSTNSRAEVRREAADAVKAGTIGKGPDVKK